MDKFQAEAIVKEYGGIVVKQPPNGIIRRKSFLPWSNAKIKHAFFVHISSIINDLGSLPEEIGNSLVILYSMMNSFVDDKKADELEEIERLVKAKKLDPQNPDDQKKFNQYLEYGKSLRDGDLFDEINEFIEECNRSKK